MKDFYDIAVMGESMAGKSTWIASLFREDIAIKLSSISHDNTEGQTKIASRYNLLNPEQERLIIQSIGWDEEKLASVYHKNLYPDLIEKLDKKFKFSPAISVAPKNTKENELKEESDDIILSSERLLPQIKKYIKQYEQNLIELGIEAIDFIKEIINDKNFNESGIISYAEIGGPTDPEIWSIIQANNLNKVTIRDTRGFLDETENQMQEYLNYIKENSKNNEYEKEENKQVYLQKLLDDRGIYGIDACVLMSTNNSNALLKTNHRNIYGPLIQHMLEKYPTFLTIRDRDMTKSLKKNKSYNEALLEIENDDDFDGFEDLRSLLNELGLYGETCNYTTRIAQNHYKELIVANIKDKINDLTIYKKSVAGSFSKIIDGINNYQEELKEANRLYAQIFENTEEQEELAIKLFNEIFDNGITYNNSDGGGNKILKYSMSYMAKRVQCGYYGGLVGPREGLTTYDSSCIGRMVGDVAIEFLETAYSIRKRILIESITAKIPAIEKYVKLCNNNKENIKEQVSLIQQQLLLRVNNILDNNENFEILACTYRMIPRYYLKYAYEQVKEELKITADNIHDYLPEFEDLFKSEPFMTTKKQEDERGYMSVVKRILWYLVKLYDPNKDIGK